MFVGIDHGTQAIRMATTAGRCWELPRTEAGQLSSVELVGLMKDKLDLSNVEMVILTYSMGDGLTKIVQIEDAKNRGLIQQDGAGLHIGGGTNVFETLKGSGWPCLLLPGIHRGSNIDPRFKVFSHGMSPEKIGLAYRVLRKENVSNFIVCDASSNTVTFAVYDGRVAGAIDASIFAPGLVQGPLDVEAIRAVDAGKMTANQAFNRGGILSKIGRTSLEECTFEEKEKALEILALFAAMEINAMRILMADLGEREAIIFLAGSPASLIEKRVVQLLGIQIQSLARCAAAEGCAMIAEDIFNGAKDILGIEVEQKGQKNQ